MKFFKGGMMIRPDVLIEIHFDMNQPEKTVIKTNAKKEALGEILATWLQNQISLGKDDSKPNMKDKFLIKIGLRIEDDTFGLESDTGSGGLTCGIVMDVFRKLDELDIHDLPEKSSD